MNISEQNSEFSFWLEKVKEKNGRVFEILKESHPIMEKCIKNKKYRETAIAMESFIWHLGLIKNGLFDLCEQDNLYAAKIIYRSFIDHWLKAQYIFSRFSKEKNDDVGMEYMKFYSLNEDVKYGRSLQEITKILNKEISGEDIWDTLFNFKPELKEIGKKEIREKAHQFEYKNVINFLINKTTIGRSFVSGIIPEYSELSSFVHGGPNVINYLIKERKNRFNLYKGMIRFSFNMYVINAWMTYLILADIIEPKLKTYASNLYPEQLMIN